MRCFEVGALLYRSLNRCESTKNLLLPVIPWGVRHPHTSVFSDAWRHRCPVPVLGMPTGGGSVAELPKFMMRLLCAQISVVRQLRRVVKTKVRLLSIDPYLSAPRARRFMETHTKEPALIGTNWTTQILHVLRARSLTEIINTVIRAHPVAVVDVVIRETPMNIEPSKSMGKIYSFIYADCQVTVKVQRTSNTASSHPAAIFPPHKYAGVRIKIKNFSDSLRRYLLCIHNTGLLFSGHAHYITRRI